MNEKQFTFTRLVSSLIDHAYKSGYTMTFGDAYRDPGVADVYAKIGKGIKNSLHCQRLAIDLMLFKDGKYLEDTKDYKFLGDYWKSLSTPGFECRWGGDFHDSHGNPKPDGDHFEIKN